MDPVTTATTPLGVFLPVEDDPALVAAIEDRGFDSIWAGEGQGRSAFGKLERWATVTEEIQLATGIVNVFSRSPATIAQSVATLDDHSGGRAILGLGAAHPGVVEQFHGIPFEHPIERVEEYVELLRLYLRGESKEYEGEFFQPSRTTFWERFEPPRREIPIYNGALGPENVRLTGRVADGWVPNFYPLDQFEKAREWLAEGATHSGRDVSELTVSMYVLVSVDDNREMARRRAADHIVSYLRDIPGFYDAPLRASGFGHEVDQVTAASTRSVAIDLVSDSLIDAVGVTGTPEDVGTGLAAYREAGVDVPIVRAPTGSDRSVLEATLDALAPDH